MNVIERGESHLEIGGDLAERVAQVRELLGLQVEKRLDEMSDLMVAGFSKEISAYTELADPKMSDDVRDTTRSHLGVLFNLVVRGTTTVDNSALALLRTLGSRRAAQGFPLHALLRAYQVGTRVAWSVILEELADLTSDALVMVEVSGSVSTALLAVTARISEEISRAFVEAQTRVATADERARRLVFEELLTGDSGEEDGVVARASRIGYRLGRSHVVVAGCFIASDDRQLAANEASATAFERQLLASFREIRPVGGAPMVDIHGALVVGIIPTSEDIPAQEIVSMVGARLPAAASTVGIRAMAGVGDVLPGVGGIATSYRQAVSALQAARGIGWRGTVATYTEMLPYLLLGGNLALTADLYRASVAPLFDSAVGRRGSAELIQTLRTYLDEQGNLGQTAKRLMVHRHTVSARLERVEQLTGARLDDPQKVFNLELGFCAWEILNARDLGPDVAIPPEHNCQLLGVDEWSSNLAGDSTTCP